MQIYDFKQDEISSKINALNLWHRYIEYKMKKLLLSAMLFSVTFAFAQFGTSAQFGNAESKWTFGGYAGLGGAFGNGGGTSIYISPKVGYKINENFETGLATNLTWANSEYLSSSMVGVGPFANYYFSRSFFLSGIFQEYFVNQKNKFDQVKYSTNESVLYLGGGYMQKLGERTYMQMGGMYNVLYKKNESVFGGGFIPNIGIVYGL